MGFTKEMLEAAAKIIGITDEVILRSEKVCSVFREISLHESMILLAMAVDTVAYTHDLGQEAIYNWLEHLKIASDQVNGMMGSEGILREEDRC